MLRNTPPAPAARSLLFKEGDQVPLALISVADAPGVTTSAQANKLRKSMGIRGTAALCSRKIRSR